MGRGILKGHYIGSGTFNDILDPVTLTPTLLFFLKGPNEYNNVYLLYHGYNAYASLILYTNLVNAHSYLNWVRFV